MFTYGEHSFASYIVLTRRKVILHCYALDCASHFLFNPGGSNTLNDPEDFKMMKELSYHDSLKRKRPLRLSLISTDNIPFRKVDRILLAHAQQICHAFHPKVDALVKTICA